MSDIIKAEKKHIEDILKITKDAFLIYQKQLDNNISLQALTETYNDVLFDIENNNVYIALIDEKIAGCIRFCKLSGDLAYIYRFAVDQNSSHSGIGTSLIKYVLTLCLSQNIKAVCLHSNSKNTDLVKFYYKNGFFIHSTEFSRGYIRALFINELSDKEYDITKVFSK